MSIIRTALPIFICAAASVAYAADRPTYTKDIAPILNENCVTCHRPNDIAPMSLLNYQEVRPWAKSIARQVYNRSMPPWHADPEYGHFKNERSLTQKQINTIVWWSHQGATEGKRGDLPKVPKFDSSGWRLGEPDYTVEFRAVTIPADGRDRFLDLEAHTGLPEDSWVTAVEIMPGDRSVVHHVILWQGQKNQQNGWIGAWGAGGNPMVFHKGTGRLLKRNVLVIADMHYHPSGTATIDQTVIGLHIAKSPKDIKAPLTNLWVINATFEIPPGAANHEVRSSHIFPEAAKIISLAPHMHYRGKDFTYTVTYPDGQVETLLKVSNYDFNWQTTYDLEKPISVPKGTKIECVAHFDNSASNLSNPDYTKAIRFGNESYDEMMIGFVDYVPDSVSLPSESKTAGPTMILTSLVLLAVVGFIGHRIGTTIFG